MKKLVARHLAEEITKGVKVLTGIRAPPLLGAVYPGNILDVRLYPLRLELSPNLERLVSGQAATVGQPVYVIAGKVLALPLVVFDEEGDRSRNLRLVNRREAVSMYR